MSPVWAVPVLVVAIGGIVLAALARAAHESARELAAEVARFTELHAALARVRTELVRSHVTATELRRS